MIPSKKTALLKIFGLQLSVNLGCTEQERDVKQTITIDIEIHFNTLPKALKSDNLNDTICFDALIKKIQDATCKKHYNLIEHIGSEIFEITKKVSPNGYVKVITNKMPKIKGFSGIAAFELAG
jgi:FolB domain-containing protein